jgi:uncharacterized membrane protein
MKPGVNKNTLMQAHREAEHNRTQFQIDRIAFFSDAVIAIALTLMILEIKIPEMGKEITIQVILNRYGWTIALHVIALFVGFSTIGNLWIRHHQLFEHIIKYNHPMIRLNLYFLFSVMLLPISIQFLFARNEPIRFQLLCYFGNLSFSSLSYSLLVRYIFLEKNNFSSIRDKQKIYKLKRDSYQQFFVFMLATILIAFDFNWFYVSFFLFPAYRIYDKIKNVSAKRKMRHQGNIE